MNRVVKNMKIQKIKYIVFVLIVVLMLYTGAIAEIKDIYVVNSTNPTIANIAKVVNQNYKKNTVYLPGAWNTEQLMLNIPDSQLEPIELRYGEKEQTLLQGEYTNCFSFPNVVIESETIPKTNLWVFKGSKIPAIFINKQENTMIMFSADGDIVYCGELKQMKIRGNNTATYPKIPYQIKLEEKTALIGEVKQKTWVLLADYIDLSLLRNRVTLDIARAINIPFAVQCQSVDLYIDGYYKGVYLLTDKVQINEGRVDIADVEDELSFINDGLLSDYKTAMQNFEDNSGFQYAKGLLPSKDITGGYLFEIDKERRILNDGFSYVRTKEGMLMLVDSPKISSKEQMKYVYELITAFDRAIHQPDGIDPITQKAYWEMADMESFALKFLLEEFTMNYDATAGSQYFHKNSAKIDDLLYAGPAWDYDLTYQNCLPTNPTEPYLTQSDNRYCWYTTLYREQPEFRKLVWELYQTVFRKEVVALCGLEETKDAITQPFESYISEIEMSAKMNFSVWPLDKIEGYRPASGGNFELSTTRMLNYIEKRIIALDELLKVE